MASHRSGRNRSSTRRSAPAPAAAPQAARRRWPLGLLVVVVLALVIVGYQWRSPREAAPEPMRDVPSGPLAAAIDVPPGAAAGFNVLLITLDTLRADRVGCYGYAGVETPVLDALAAGGVRFADAVTVVPLTLPSHASILTGQYPPRISVRNNGMHRLVDDHGTLGERLQDAGYATAAFIGAFVLDRRYGLDQGFDVYDDQITPQELAPGVEPLNPQRPGNVVVDAAMRWLDEYHQAGARRPFFAWVHLFDPHMPYEPPEPFKSRYAGRPYDGEVAFTDVQVGRLMDKLRSLKSLDKTLIVAVGDHGEGLGDHGEGTHSLLIYEATMAVPLLFHCPGLIPAGQVVDDRLVATTDLMPTILDVLGLEPGDSDGVSLLRAGADPDRAVYLETLAPQLNHGWSPLFGLRRHHDKYIEAPTPEYYDLRNDPGELDNLWLEDMNAGTPLAERLVAQMDAFAETDAKGATVELDQEAIEKLASLGYVSGGVAADDEALLDPKDVIARFDEQLAQANALVNSRRAPEAIPLINSLLGTMPADASLWSLLSTAQMQVGQLDPAIKSRLRAIQLQPADANAWVLLATFQHAKGDVAASRLSLDEAERLEPDLGSIYINRALLAFYAGNLEEALVQCAEAQRRDPNRFTGRACSLRAKIYEVMGKPDEARAARQQAQQAGGG